MKVKSSLITQASGSVGGFTWSHNRGGMYVRARATPVNPNTQYQQLVRAIVGQLAALWVDTLTPVQRAAWDLYALQVPLADRLGEPRNVGGLAMYVRSNTPRIQGALPRVDDGPTTFSLPGLEGLVMESPSEATQAFNLDYQTEPVIPEVWLSEDDAGMPVYISRPQNASINYFKGPYRLQEVMFGSSGTPAEFPQDFGVPFPFVQGQKVFVRVQLSRADGRLSLSQFLGEIALNGPAAGTDKRPPRQPKEDAPKDDKAPGRRKRKTT